MVHAEQSGRDQGKRHRATATGGGSRLLRTRRPRAARPGVLL